MNDQFLDHVQAFPETPYRFLIATVLGTGAIDIAPTQWDMADKMQIKDFGSPGIRLIIEKVLNEGYDTRGKPMSLTAAAPMDIAHVFGAKNDWIFNVEVVFGFMPSGDLPPLTGMDTGDQTEEPPYM